MAGSALARSNEDAVGEGACPEAAVCGSSSAANVAKATGGNPITFGAGNEVADVIVESSRRTLAQAARVDRFLAPKLAQRLSLFTSINSHLVR